MEGPDYADYKEDYTDSHQLYNAFPIRVIVVVICVIRDFFIVSEIS